MTNPEPTPNPLVTDLQQRVQALEAELQTRQQQAMTLFSEAPAPYVLLNSQGRVQEVNAAGCALLGRSREVLLGKRLGGFLTPESQGSFDVLLQQVLDGGLKHRGEARVLHADDTPFDVLLDVDASIVDGAFQHFRLVMTDITAHQQVKQDLLDTTTAQERQLQEQAARIRALNQELEQIVATFLQQLHLPTARAMNFLGLLRQALGEQPEQVTAPLLKTERAVQAVIALLATLDRYMGLRSMRVRLQRVDLNKVLDQVIKEAQPQLVGRNLRITRDSLPTVQGDIQGLYLILNEYVSNAVKFTKEREAARVHVLARETETEYHIGVEDNGTGFNMRQKDRIFQLFGRLHSSRDYEGTGVGLMTVRRVCERFGGRAWGEGKVDQGSTFWFAWPKQPRLRE
ncbi:sensor histidine kinase [Deinococcus apachensis]|uniref:sensor histidine kinase n=1 Tax=Deinococcus apachensis TaxID=309886 RepID=UPI0003619B1C|nr:ATP-binding protein [Deinococcus apachensis]